MLTLLPVLWHVSSSILHSSFLHSENLPQPSLLTDALVKYHGRLWAPIGQLSSSVLGWGKGQEEVGGAGLALGLVRSLHASRACASAHLLIPDLFGKSSVNSRVSEEATLPLAHLGTEVLRVPWSELWLGAGLSGPKT